MYTLDDIKDWFDTGNAVFVYPAENPQQTRNNLYKKAVRRGYRWMFSCGYNAVYIRQQRGN